MQAKQTQMEELTAGQASTLARNEAEIDKANEQIEELEETLADSVADAMKGRQRREEPTKKRKCVSERHSCPSEFPDLPFHAFQTSVSTGFPKFPECLQIKLLCMKCVFSAEHVHHGTFQEVGGFPEATRCGQSQKQCQAKCRHGFDFLIRSGWSLNVMLRVAISQENKWLHLATMCVYV
jgi:hypothetical protein